MLLRSLTLVSMNMLYCPKSFVCVFFMVTYLGNFPSPGLARCKYKTYLSTKKIDAGTVAYM